MRAPSPSSLPRFVAIVFALAVALLTAAPATRAEKPITRPTCDELPCSVNRICSSTGKQCHPLDADCIREARDANLEIKCEQQCSNGKHFVYCPADTGRGSDSRVVWILLSLAVVLAVGGTSLAWLVLRKKVV